MRQSLSEVCPRSHALRGNARRTALRCVAYRTRGSSDYAPQSGWPCVPTRSVGTRVLVCPRSHALRGTPVAQLRRAWHRGHGAVQTTRRRAAGLAFPRRAWERGNSFALVPTLRVGTQVASLRRAWPIGHGAVQSTRRRAAGLAFPRGAWERGNLSYQNDKA